MDSVPREIREYLTEEGKNPFSDWFKSLRDVRTQARIDARLNRLRCGQFGDAKAVGGGVHELRLDFGPGYRVYFGQNGRVLIILLCGGDKRTQTRDIARAQTYWSSYMRRIRR